MNPVAMGALKWAPRLASLLVAGGYLAIAIAELMHPHSGPPQGWREWSGIILMSIASLAPLAAWRWRIPAACVSLSALLLFTLVVHMNRYDPLIVMAMPALLFIADGALRREVGGARA